MDSFERDFKLVKHFFPKLTYRTASNHPFWQIEGKIDIQDITGCYLETFDIIVKVSKQYPYCVPMLFEKSNLIERHEDWHISDQGLCCIDVPNRLEIEAKRGINILEFIKNKVYSYFANQLYKKQNSQYANGEYKHFTEGTLQYYLEDLGLTSIDEILKILSSLNTSTKLDRNGPCLCGSGKKLKKCHINQINLIISSGKERILMDLFSIDKYKNS